MHKFFLSLLACFISIQLHSALPLKIIGYLPTYRFSMAESIEVEKLTHLNIAFAHPNSIGDLVCAGNYQNIIQRVRSKNPDLKVMISVAGGGLTQNQKLLWKKYMSAEYRSGFISNIIRFLRSYDLDGVDMDLEWNDVDTTYAPFTRELSDSLRIYRYIFSAAFPAMKRYSVLENKDFEVFDFINIMAYDNAGPWRPNDVGQHSSLDLARRAINFWNTICEVPRDRIVLGIPCYGYDFNCRPVKGKPYSSMVSCDRFLAFEDKSDLTFYNSIPTIVEKSKLARESCGGIMLWELGQDAVAEYGDYSLLHFVFATFIENEREEFVPRSKRFRLDNTPQNLEITITGAIQEGAYFVLQDLDGANPRIIHFSSWSSKISVSMDDYVNGIYLLTLIEPHKSTTEKFIKIRS